MRILIESRHAQCAKVKENSTYFLIFLIKFAHDATAREQPQVKQRVLPNQLEIKNKAIIN
jgi:hypothetical protein